MRFPCRLCAGVGLFLFPLQHCQRAACDRLDLAPGEVEVQERKSRATGQLLDDRRAPRDVDVLPLRRLADVEPADEPHHVLGGERVAQDLDLQQPNQHIGTVTGLPILRCTNDMERARKSRSETRRAIMSHARMPMVSASSVIAASIGATAPSTHALATSSAWPSVSVSTMRCSRRDLASASASSRSSLPRNRRKGRKLLARW